jgi:glyoxylase-like metal-dependent hydrolase (beta-lactamase superfamily II)
MEVQQLAEGFWHWTGVHPEWEPEPEELPREVGCVYYEAEDAVVLIDPLAPPEAREHFLESLDRDVERARRPVAILLTCPWHARSAGELAERYGAGVWMHGEDSRQPLEAARQFAFGDGLPGGVTSFDAHFHGEALLWIPSHRTLVAGDVLAVSAGGLRVAPDEWLAPEERDGQILTSLRFLLDLPVERVLVGHGEPVLVDAREALEHAFQAASSE